MLVKATRKVTSSSSEAQDVVFLKYLGQHLRRTHFYKYHNIPKQDKTRQREVSRSTMDGRKVTHFRLSKTAKFSAMYYYTSPNQIFTCNYIFYSKSKIYY